MAEPADSSVSIRELLSSTVEVGWPEAVALVQSAAVVMPPGSDPYRCTLSGAGHLAPGTELGDDGLPATPPRHAFGRDTDVTRLAKLLDELLPPPGTGGSRAPGGLRYAVMRALGGVTAPPFASVDEFAGTLARFEQGARAEHLAAVHTRWLAQRSVAPRTATLGGSEATSAAPAEERSFGAEAAMAPNLVAAPGELLPTAAAAPEGEPFTRPQWDRWTSDPWDVAASDPNRDGEDEDAVAEAERATAGPAWDTADPVLLRAEIPPEQIPPLGSPFQRRDRQPAGRLLTAAAIVSMLFALAIVAAAILVTDPVRRAQLVDSSREIAAGAEDARDSLARRWQSAVSRRGGENVPADDEAQAGRAASAQAPADSATMSGATDDPVAAAATKGGTDDTPPVDRARTTAAPPGVEASRSAPGEAGAGAPSSPASPATASSPAAAALDASAWTAPPLPGDFVVGLDEARRPVFSPAFGSDGTVIFSQSANSRASQAREDGSESSPNALHLLSVVTEDARNYHPQLSPDGGLVAFDSDRGGVRGVYVSERNGDNVRRVSGDGYAALPRWSPDGRLLTFVKAEPSNPRVWNVWSLNLASGQLERLTSHGAGQPWGASWLPDGRRICYSLDDRVIVFDPRSGQSRAYPAPRRGTLVGTPAVSPNGRHAIVRLQGAGGWLLNLDDGSTRQIIEDPTAQDFAWAPDGSRAAYYSGQDRRWAVWVRGK